MISRKSTESTEVIESSQTIVHPKKNIATRTRKRKVTQTESTSNSKAKNSRELSYMDKSSIIPSGKRTRTQPK